MNKLVWLALALSLASTMALAEDAPPTDVAVDYSHLEVLKGYNISMNGGSGSFAYNLKDWLGVAADVGGYHGYPGQSLTGDTLTLGPRFTYRRFAHVQPFAQGLFGGSHFNASSGGITGGGMQLAFSGGVGTDIVPHRDGRFSVRLQRDYFGVRSGGANTVCDRLSAGIAFRFGRR